MKCFDSLKIELVEIHEWLPIPTNGYTHMFVYLSMNSLIGIHPLPAQANIIAASTPQHREYDATIYENAHHGTGVEYCFIC